MDQEKLRRLFGEIYYQAEKAEMAIFCGDQWKLSAFLDAIKIRTEAIQTEMENPSSMELPEPEAGFQNDGWQED
jgi:hypothetical protein